MPVPPARRAAPGGTHRAARRRLAPVALVVVALLLAVVPAVGLVAVLVTGGSASGEGASGGGGDASPAAAQGGPKVRWWHAGRPTAGASEVNAAAVVRDWDEARAVAYAAGDVPALRLLYPEGSPLAAEDVAVLAAYEDRGLRLHGVGFELVSASTVEHAPDRLVVGVTERLRRADVRRTDGAATGVRTPSAPSTRRVLTFTRGDDATWRLTEVRSSGPALS